MDAHATKVATGYTGLATKRAQIVKVMRDRQYLNANAVHWKTPERPERQYVLTYLHDEPVAWCQLCDVNAVEDTCHVLGWCKYET